MLASHTQEINTFNKTKKDNNIYIDTIKKSFRARNKLVFSFRERINKTKRKYNNIYFMPRYHHV